MRARSLMPGIVAIAILASGPLAARAASEGKLGFLADDHKTLVTVRCLGNDGRPMSWRGVADGPVDHQSYVATSMAPVVVSAVVQCRNADGSDGTLDGVVPASDIVPSGSNVTYIDVVSIELPRTIHSLHVGGKSVRIRSSKRGLILVLPSFIQVFPASAVLNVAVRAAVVIDKPAFGGNVAARADSSGTCSVAYIGENGKQTVTRSVNRSCDDLLDGGADDDAIFSKSL